jgi:hypothetical protein
MDKKKTAAPLKVPLLLSYSMQLLLHQVSAQGYFLGQGDSMVNEILKGRLICTRPDLSRADLLK